MGSNTLGDRRWTTGDDTPEVSCQSTSWPGSKGGGMWGNREDKVDKRNKMREKEQRQKKLQWWKILN